MPHKNQLRITSHEVISSAGVQRFYTPYVRDGQVWEVRRFTWETDKATSGGNTRARIYIDRGGILFPIAEQDAPAADTLYSIVDPFFLIEGERLVVELDQGQAATTVESHIIGFEEQFANPGPAGALYPPML